MWYQSPPLRRSRRGAGDEARSPAGQDARSAPRRRPPSGASFPPGTIFPQGAELAGRDATRSPLRRSRRGAGGEAIAPSPCPATTLPSSLPCHAASFSASLRSNRLTSPAQRAAWSLTAAASWMSSVVTKRSMSSSIDSEWLLSRATWPAAPRPGPHRRGRPYVPVHGQPVARHAGLLGQAVAVVVAPAHGGDHQAEEHLHPGIPDLVVPGQKAAGEAALPLEPAWTGVPAYTSSRPKLSGRLTIAGHAVEEGQIGADVVQRAVGIEEDQPKVGQDAGPVQDLQRALVLGGGGVLVQGAQAAVGARFDAHVGPRHAHLAQPPEEPLLHIVGAAFDAHQHVQPAASIRPPSRPPASGGRGRAGTTHHR